VRAEEMLRRYLEQRRELGEQELVLDSMSVDEVMRLIGAARAGRSSAGGEPGSGGEAAGSIPVVSDGASWREALRAAGVDETPSGRAATGKGRARPRAPEERAEPTDGVPAAAAAAAGDDPPTDPPRNPAPSGAGAPPGLVVGSGERELFGGPLGECNTIDEIAAVVRECTRCPLYRTATHPVPGEGNPHAQLMCVGEAPGANEDATGRPFVGQAGQLLTKILAAIKLSREDVFIANVLKHRPPGNRNPLPDEVEACRPYLVRQVELIRPKVIVAFGTFAAQTLLETKLPIGKLRGAVHRYHGIPVVVTYHPAALLRNPAWKRPTWEDVQLARRILDNAAA
jgi:uracil-DNA glycosylase family 4